MLQTIQQMALLGDQEALEGVWRLLGGEGPLTADASDGFVAVDGSFAEELDKLAGDLGEDGQSFSELPVGEQNGLLVLMRLVDAVYGRKAAGDPYAAERASLAELAHTFDVRAGRYPTVEALEDAIVEAMARTVQEKIKTMSEDERRKLVEDMLRRMTDEDRLRFVDRVLGDMDSLSPEQREQLISDLASELDLDADVLESAIAGGAGALLPLMIAKGAGFSIFLLSTNVMYVLTSRVGITLPFAVYVFKNRALGWLLGPVGMLVTTGLSAGWFGVKTWRRRERFRKLVQLVAFVCAWRETHPEGT
jgi:hypothetical protein